MFFIIGAVLGFVLSVVLVLVWRNKLSIAIVAVSFWVCHLVIPGWMTGVVRAPLVAVMLPLEVLKHTGPLRWFFYVAWPVAVVSFAIWLFGQVVERWVKPYLERPVYGDPVLSDPDSIWF